MGLRNMFLSSPLPHMFQRDHPAIYLLDAGGSLAPLAQHPEDAYNINAVTRLAAPVHSSASNAAATCFCQRIAPADS